MTYLVNDIVLPLDFVEGEAFSKAEKRLRSAGIMPGSDVRYSLFRRSVDARRREDIRFTVGHGCIYAFAMNYPESGEILIRSIAKKDNGFSRAFYGIIDDVKIPGYEGPVEFERREEGLHVKAAVSSPYPVVIKIITRSFNLEYK